MDPHDFEEFRTALVSRPVLLICNELNADLDPAFYLHADPNPDSESQTHKVLIYIEHHSVCPLVGIGTPPPL
jgi:hypothetical protein